MRRLRSTQLVGPLDAAITAISAATVPSIHVVFFIIVVSFPVGVFFFFCAVISRQRHLTRFAPAAAAIDAATHLYRRAESDVVVVVVVVDLSCAVPEQFDQDARLGREPAALDSRSR